MVDPTCVELEHVFPTFAAGCPCLEVQQITICFLISDEIKGLLHSKTLKILLRHVPL